MPRMTPEQKLIYVKKTLAEVLEPELVEHYVNAVQDHNYCEILNYLENNGFETKTFKDNWGELQRQIKKLEIDRNMITTCCSNYASGNKGPKKIIFERNNQDNWSDTESFFLLLCKFNFLFAKNLQLIEGDNRQVLSDMLLRVGINRTYNSIRYRELLLNDSDREMIYNELCELFKTQEIINKTNPKLSAMLKLKHINATSDVIAQIKRPFLEKLRKNHAEDLQNTKTNTIVIENPDINITNSNPTNDTDGSFEYNTNNHSDSNNCGNQYICQNDAINISSNKTDVTTQMNDPFYGKITLPSFTYNGNSNTTMNENPLAINDYSNNQMNVNFITTLNNLNTQINENILPIFNNLNTQINENILPMLNYLNTQINENILPILNNLNTQINGNPLANTGNSNNQMNGNNPANTYYSNTQMDQNYYHMSAIPNSMTFSSSSVTNEPLPSSDVYDTSNTQMNENPAINDYSNIPMNENSIPINDYSNIPMNENSIPINDYSNTQMNQNNYHMPVIPNSMPFSSSSVTNGPLPSSGVYDYSNTQMDDQYIDSTQFTQNDQ